MPPRVTDKDWKMPPVSTDKITADTLTAVSRSIDQPVGETVPALVQSREYVISKERKDDLDDQARLAEALGHSSGGRRAGDTMERHNAGKLKLGLIPASLNKFLASVLMYGARKYAEHNWRKGGSWTENYESLQRHIDLWREGEDIDEESGLPHLAHMAFNVMALIEFYDKGLGTDDRFRYPSQPRDARNPGRTLRFREPPRRV